MCISSRDLSFFPILKFHRNYFGLCFSNSICICYRHHRDILTDKDCEHVYELVYSSHRAVAQAAGEFLNERLFVPDEEAVAGVRTKRGKKRLPNTPLIRDLVQFFIESEVSQLKELF